MSLSPFECLSRNFILPESANYVFLSLLLRNLLYLIQNFEMPGLQGGHFAFCKTQLIENRIKLNIFSFSLIISSATASKPFLLV